MNTESERNDGFRIVANGYDKDQVNDFIFELFVQLHDAQRRVAHLEQSANVVPLRKAS